VQSINNAILQNARTSTTLLSALTAVKAVTIKLKIDNPLQSVKTLQTSIVERRLKQVRQKITSTNKVLIDQLIALLDSESDRRRKRCNVGNKGIFTSEHELADDNI